MPELPEVETVVRTLRPQILGAVLEAVHVPDEKVLQNFIPGGVESLRACRIERIFRRAKLIMLCLSSSLRPLDPLCDYILAFHLKMTGSFFVHPQGAAARKHTRLIFDLSRAEGTEPSSAAMRLFFDDTRRFGYCRLMLPDQLAGWDFWKELGPEPLELDASTLAACLQGRRGLVKAALLNQKIVAGIGNIYADEALFRAGIAPQTRLECLSPARVLTLAVELQGLLREAIAECGSSIRDYRDALGNAGAFQNNFFVYGRKGLACLRCSGTLQGVKLAGRSTVFCPFCQTS